MGRSISCRCKFVGVSKLYTYLFGFVILTQVTSNCSSTYRLYNLSQTVYVFENELNSLKNIIRNIENKIRLEAAVRNGLLLRYINSDYLSVSITSDPPAIIKVPTNTFQLMGSFRIMNARKIVITTLILSIGATFDASPSCSALK